MVSIYKSGVVPLAFFNCENVHTISVNKNVSFLVTLRYVSTFYINGFFFFFFLNDRLNNSFVNVFCSAVVN